MLIDQVSDPLVRLKVLHSKLSDEERAALAKQAFLHVIAHHNAFKFQKKKVLDEIAQICPDIRDTISEEEMFNYFEDFCAEAKRRNEIVSTAELTWVNRYISSLEIRLLIEKLIYRTLLAASSHWNKLRWDFQWQFNDQEKLMLAREVLRDSRVSAKRKVEIAREFTEPGDDYLRAYYKKLLYDRHYEQAAALEVKSDEIVIEILIKNINYGYFRDALELAEKFLPHQPELAEEIKQIITAFA